MNLKVFVWLKIWPRKTWLWYVILWHDIAATVQGGSITYWAKNNMYRWVTSAKETFYSMLSSHDRKIIYTGHKLSVAIRHSPFAISDLSDLAQKDGQLEGIFYLRFYIFIVIMEWTNLRNCKKLCLRKTLNSATRLMCLSALELYKDCIRCT